MYFNRRYLSVAAALLGSRLPRWKTWWVAARIHQNIDLLTLEGRPATNWTYRTAAAHEARGSRVRASVTGHP